MKKAKLILLLTPTLLVAVSCGGGGSSSEPGSDYSSISVTDAKQRISAITTEISKETFSVPTKATIDLTNTVKMETIEISSTMLAAYDLNTQNPYAHIKTESSSPSSSSDSSSGLEMWLYKDGGDYVYAAIIGQTKAVSKYAVDSEKGKELISGIENSLTSSNASAESFKSTLDSIDSMVESYIAATEGSLSTDGASMEISAYAKGAGDLKVTIKGTGNLTSGESSSESFYFNYVFANYLPVLLETSTVTSTAETSTRATFSWGSVDYDYPDLTEFSSVSA